MYDFFNLKSEFIKSAFFVLQLAGYAYFSLIFFLLLFPQVLYGLPVSVNSNSIVSENRNSQISLFSDEYLQEIEMKLSDYVGQLGFKDKECSLSHLTQNTQLPLHHLSYYFNQVLQIKFPEWRNRLRVEHARKLMTDGKADEMTLEALAAESGFGTRGTFIEAFKKETGLRPSEFLKELKSNGS